jgi:hypothetical protein
LGDAAEDCAGEGGDQSGEALEELKGTRRPARCIEIDLVMRACVFFGVVISLSEQGLFRGRVSDVSVDEPVKMCKKRRFHLTSNGGNLHTSVAETDLSSAISANLRPSLLLCHLFLFYLWYV